MTRILSSTLAAVSILSSPHTADARTWTDVKGKTIEAEMVSKSADTVTILFKGKELTMPLERFSQEDRDFVENWEPETKEENGSEKDKITDAQIEKYFNLPWPKLVSVDSGLDIEEEKGEDESFIYRSPNYEFISNTKLSKVVVKRFAVLFEATRQYVQELPYASLKAYQEGKRYQVFLFDTEQSYIRAGGPQGSAGAYFPDKDVIMVPCQSLGLVKRGSSWAVDYDKTNKTLPHEITHQLMDSEYYAAGAMGWFSEGIAEYIAATPYRSGKFSVNKAQSAIEQNMTGFSDDGQGRNLGEEFEAPDLQEFMMLDYGQFAGRNANFNYGLAALLVTYFNHYDGEGDAENMKNFLRALKDGKEGLEAIEALKAGRTFDELEADITKGWRKRGVKINFK